MRHLTLPPFVTHDTVHKPSVVPVIRRPAVAGYFYPADPHALARQVGEFTQRSIEPVPAVAVLLPHGGYRHAGAIAGTTLARVQVPRRCILVGPSHAGSWMPWSLMTSGAYRTPLGDVPVDEAAAEALRTRCPFLEADAWVQRGEHALEVLVPFLQRLAPSDLQIVPIITTSDDPEAFDRLAGALAQVVRLLEEPVLLIASSDLSHYEPRAAGAVRDRALLTALRALDTTRLLHEVREQGTLMCGYGAAAAVFGAASRLGARSAVVAAYGTSADADGDPDSVIGYAGLIIRESQDDEELPRPP